MHPFLAEIFGVDGIIVLLVVVGVLFGSSQIPKLARSLGSAQSEFKKGLQEVSGEKKDVQNDKVVVREGDEPTATTR